MPSSVVAVMNYKERSATLRITYVSGKVYDYRNVPPKVYKQMKAADSKGTFLNRYIKGCYPFKRIR